MNPFQPSPGGGFDAFVTQLSDAGSTLVYSSYLGGRGNEVGYAIAVDATRSCGDHQEEPVRATFRWRMPLQPAVAGGLDAFVTKIASERVNHPPVADAGDDQTVAEGTLVALDGWRALTLMAIPSASAGSKPMAPDCPVRLHGGAADLHRPPGRPLGDTGLCLHGE